MRDDFNGISEVNLPKQELKTGKARNMCYQKMMLARLRLAQIHQTLNSSLRACKQRQPKLDTNCTRPQIM